MKYLWSRTGAFKDNQRYQLQYMYSRSVLVPIRTMINQGFLLCS